MKNFRITVNGKAQFVAADECDCTPKKIVFYSARKIVKVVEPAVVKMVEELDAKLRPSRVVFRNHSAVSSTSRQACAEVLKKLLQGRKPEPE